MDVEVQAVCSRSQDPAAGPQPGAGLRILGGFYEGLVVPLCRQRLVVGRGHIADLVLAESTLSRSHAVVGFDGHGAFVEDLGSTNGTLVNGCRRKRARLHDGDELRMGRISFRIELPGGVA